MRPRRIGWGQGRERETRRRTTERSRDRPSIDESENTRNRGAALRTSECPRRSRELVRWIWKGECEGWWQTCNGKVPVEGASPTTIETNGPSARAREAERRQASMVMQKCCFTGDLGWSCKAYYLRLHLPVQYNPSCAVRCLPPSTVSADTKNARLMSEKVQL